MTRTTSPTVSRRWIALEMKRLRQQAGLSQAAVAKALGCQVPKVSLMENGQRPVHDDDLRTLLDLFDVSDDTRQHYIDESKNAHEKGWWEQPPYDEHTIPPWYSRFIGLEQGAARIRAYQPAVIHGLLQTPEYATELFMDTPQGGSAEKIARLVDVRRRRQRVLETSTNPPELCVILDEAATRRLVGSPEAMSRQLRHLVSLCRANSNITVLVVPFESGGAYEAACGPFTILDFGFTDHPSLVYRERRSASEFLDSLVEIDDHSLMFERLTDLALSPRESLRMLSVGAERYHGRPG
jgi:transcriptional regulator with XRE-family HTH domain